MREFGLIGFPLAHSFSEKYFSKKFEKEKVQDCTYKLFPLESLNKFKNLIEENKLLQGLNVTIPYKKDILHHLDSLDKSAEEVGAVNTIKIFRDENSTKLVGYNTDIFGFEKSFLSFVGKEKHNTLILGTGGGASAVAAVFKKHKFQFRFLSRNKSDAKTMTYADINEEQFESYKIIINTTPLGMFPDTENCPNIPFHLLNENYFLFDLIYNPEETLFLKIGKEMGAKTKNGLEMLHLQAEKSWEIWNS